MDDFLTEFQGRATMLNTPPEPDSKNVDLAVAEAVKELTAKIPDTFKSITMKVIFETQQDVLLALYADFETNVFTKTGIKPTSNYNNLLIEMIQSKSADNGVAIDLGTGTRIDPAITLTS